MLTFFDSLIGIHNPDRPCRAAHFAILYVTNPAYSKMVTTGKESVEILELWRLLENVQMQGARNPEE